MIFPLRKTRLTDGLGVTHGLIFGSSDLCIARRWEWGFALPQREEGRNVLLHA